jgi:V/A-type H+/Na+-transporting ATPase subunit F
MHKIKFIAPKHLIGPLEILGIEIYPAEGENEAKQALDRATEKKEPALIFITERLAVDIAEDVEKLNKKPDINIVMIPDNQGSTGLASAQIQQLVRNSIGAEVVIRQ